MSMDVLYSSVTNKGPFNVYRDAGPVFEGPGGLRVRKMFMPCSPSSKGNCKESTSRFSYERALKVLMNDMCITE